MRVACHLTLTLLLRGVFASAQSGPPGILVSAPDPSAGSPTVLVGYGDTRFTKTSETDATNPGVRRLLVEQIALEKPAAIIMSGDLPWHGQEKKDYAVFREETKSWRDAGLFVSPALGNHELNGSSMQKCLENWWTAFPKLRGVRWYAASVGSSVLVLNLDSTSSLLPDSDQHRWIEDELGHLPAGVKFVFVNLHHPPVSDKDPSLGASHNVRPNEVALADMLRNSPARRQAAFVVAAGHIHNYERFLQDGITYLVSGGGGAAPKLTKRDARDLYRSPSPINYHYVKFTVQGKHLSGEMIRLAVGGGGGGAAAPVWEVRDRFSMEAP